MKTRQRRTSKRATVRRNNEVIKMKNGGNTTLLQHVVSRMTGVSGGGEKFGIHVFTPKKTKVKGFQRDQKGCVIKLA